MSARVQVARSGLSCAASEDDLVRLRAEFERRPCLRWPGFLERDLLALVQRQVDEAAFAPMVHAGVGVDLRMTKNATLGLLHFLTNDPELFRLVRRVTGCGPIGCFAGRVYRMVPGGDHYDSWHSDSGRHRLIGLSVNLGRDVYQGGTFQLREEASQELLCEVANTGAGDAIVFRIADHLRHRITPVLGTVPKTAFAGWFQSEPDFLSLAKKSRSSPEAR